jgi:hypothetical protein
MNHNNFDFENQFNDYAQKFREVYYPGGDRQPGREEACSIIQEEKSAPPLSTAHIRPFIEITVGASLIKSSKSRKFEPVGGGVRGSVKGFSRGSRRRLMLLIASVKRAADLPCFITLTYPDKFPDPDKAKRDLKIYIQRLHRKFPAAGLIWKMEPQERGAPHFHFLCWGVKENELFGFTVPNWYEIAGQGDINHLRFHAGALPGSVPCVSQVRSFKGVWSYASKYIGKTFQVAGWGDKWTGRYWGVSKRENIPFGEVYRVETTENRVCKLMRLQRRFSHIPAKGNMNSLSVFCDADQWHERMAEMLVT